MYGGYRIYLQVEQGKLCIKIELPKDYSHKNSISREVCYNILRFREEKGLKEIVRPKKLSNKGTWRTVAIISKENWLGKDEEMLDKDRVISVLNKYIAFLKDFSASLI